MRADAENRQKDGDNFYKLDAESVVTIREELSDDFLSLAGEQLVAVGRLVEQLDTQLQFERYERERRQQMETRRMAAINISDEEKSPEQTQNAAETGGSQPKVAQEEQPKVADPKEPVQAGHQEQEEPRTNEMETEARKGLEPKGMKVEEEEQAEEQ